MRRRDPERRWPSEISLLLLLFHARRLVVVDRPALPFRGAGDEHFLDDFGERRGLALDRAGQRVAAQGAEAHRARDRNLAFPEREAIVVDHQDHAVALHGRARRGEVERHDRDVLRIDVLPDVEFGPVGQREDADRLALGLAGVVEAPQFGALVLRIPAVLRGAEAEHALLGAALLLVAARAAEGRVETVLVDRLLQPLSLPHVGVEAAMVERVDALPLRLWIAVDDQFHPALARDLVAQRIHVAELPGGVDVEQGERRRRGMEGLARQMQHHRRILAHRIEHHRILGLGDDLAHDLDALRLEPLEVGEIRPFLDQALVGHWALTDWMEEETAAGCGRTTSPMMTVTGASGSSSAARAARSTSGDETKAWSSRVAAAIATAGVNGSSPSSIARATNRSSVPRGM